MSVKKNETLSQLLDTFFRQQNIQVSFEYILNRLKKINCVDDIKGIDQNYDDPLWLVVPQILIYKFELAAFQEFQPSYSVNKSFIFIHPMHRNITEQLKNELTDWDIVSGETDIVLTEQVVSVLYGGYEWYSSYFEACRHLKAIGQAAKIILLDNISQKKISALIDYKNENRKKLAEPMTIKKQILNTKLDGIINSFHTPDYIENARQMIGLRLHDMCEVVNG